MASSIEFRALTRYYGALRAVDAVDLEVEAGEFVTLLGPSGCGKSTIVRMAGGFLRPTSGDIIVDGRSVVHLPPQAREIGTVFQHYALFPHMTVAENVGFGLRVRKWKRAQIRDRADEMLELVQLSSFRDFRPPALSGGMQQRVALARALAPRPRMVLMDEPLGALDVALRDMMQRELKRIQRELGVTTIYVTHDQDEALFMSDRIAVMSAGKVEQYATPHDIYHHPRSRFVAEFVGRLNLWTAERVDEGASTAYRVGDACIISAGPDDAPSSGDALVGVRPERISVLIQPSIGQSMLRFPGRVEEVTFRGDADLVAIDVPRLREVVTAQCLTGLWEPGKEVWVEWSPSDLIVVPTANAPFLAQDKGEGVGVPS
ncbi:MAG: ATP-binding cassette domain-containing protein [Actinobacteria bacterium]|nr:ATP-binding cassette domain-containing protein [Actinomycetota bacterium]